MRTYQEFYSDIAKPFFAPPPWVFGAAWGIIYPLIALALAYTLYLYLRKGLPRYFLWLFGVNLVANVLFTPIQLGLTAFWPASLDILVILGTLAIIEYRMWARSKVVFFLLVPYLLWGAFATVLQFTISYLN